MKRCVIIAAVLLLVGCSSGQVVSGVEAVVAASEAVIPLIPGISPAVRRGSRKLPDGGDVGRLLRQR